MQGFWTTVSIKIHFLHVSILLPELGKFKEYYLLWDIKYYRIRFCQKEAKSGMKWVMKALTAVYKKFYCDIFIT